MAMMSATWRELWITLIWLTLLCSACRDPDHPGLDRVERNGAILGEDPGLWAVDESAAWEIDGGAGGALLTEVVGAAIVDSDHVVLANGRLPPVVRLHGRTSGLEWEFGGEGAGPGEFAVIARAWPDRAGHFVVWDPVLGRITAIDVVDGEMSAVPAVQDGGVYSGTVAIHGLVGDSVLVGRPNAAIPPDARGAGLAALPLLVRRAGHSTWDTLDVLPRLEYYETSSGSVAPIPLGPQAVLAATSTTIVTGFGDDFSLTEIAPTGEHLLVFGRRLESRPITEAHREAFRRELLSRVTGGGAEQWHAIVAARLLDAPFPSRLPALDRIVAAKDGSVWVRHFLAPGGAVETWSIFDEDRHLSGEITLPPGLRLLDASDDAVLGVVEDDLGVPSLRYLPLLK
jgi:hypothetical protein